MNEKEFNLQVLAKLVEIANVIFAKLTINIEGTFMAAELWEGKNSLNENIVIDYHGTQFDTYTVEVGTFKCSFTPEKVFYLVWKFEQLCRVRQENKARFTYGIEKREIITGKAMYIGNGGKVIKRKKTLVRLSEHVAYEPCKIYEWVYLYYFVDGIWYYISQVQSKHQREKIAGRMENEPEWFKNLLAKWDYTQDIAINTIYKALRDVLCAEVIKDTSKERKCENEAGNSVICDNVGTYTHEKSESVQETNEDYPPEPYNKEKSENVASLATIKTRNVATSYERFQDRTICGRFQKNMCPNYLRKKVFPTESFQSRCKIRRFKPFSCLRYTNYHSCGESVANQTGSGKSGGYSVVAIRGSAKRKGKINSLSP